MTARIQRDYSGGSSPLTPGSDFRADSECRLGRDLSEKVFLDFRPRTDSPSALRLLTVNLSERFGGVVKSWHTDVQLDPYEKC